MKEVKIFAGSITFRSVKCKLIARTLKDVTILSNSVIK